MARIVVGTPPGAAAQAALRWAADEGAARHLPVVAALCWSFPGRHGPGGPAADGTPGEGPSPTLAAVVAAALGDDGIGRVTPRDVLAHPAPGLLSLVGPDDLLVLGAEGTRLSRGLVVGSISQACAHRAPCPVAVVHADLDPSPAGAPVLVGVDGSAPSLAALRWARAAARDHGVAVRAVRATPDGRADAGIAGVESVTGDAADVLVAASAGARMLVVGSHGHGNLAGLVLGSVAHRVAHLAAGPVVLVPVGPRGDQGPCRPGRSGPIVEPGQT